MKIIQRILVGSAVVVVLVVTGVYLYLKGITPSYSGKQEVKGLISSVDVHYDEFGIPHIYAQNESDAYFALGYVHARERLFQMEMIRRAAAGRLSEVLGPDLLDVDKLFRTLGINQFAKKHAAQLLSSDTANYQRAVAAYQKGINEFIRTGPTPLEFTLAGIPKEEFKPEDVFLAHGFISLSFAEALKADPVLELIHTKLGTNYLKDLAVQVPADAERLPTIDGPRKTPQSLITSISQALEKLPVPMWQGSNGWAISGEHTASGFPILANDTHMQYAQPAVWFEAHFEYPGFSFYGHHAAGVPFALLGNNRKSGWGMTMFENDDLDFFKETIHEDGRQVLFNGNWQPLVERDEVIKVKGQNDVVLKVKSTTHGPIINGIIDAISADADAVSLWWALDKGVNQSIEAIYRLNHASNLAEAETAAALFFSPGLNVMYADVDGNIAWWAVAKLPIRAPHVESKLFLDGASGKDEYLGFYDFSKNPHAINPPWGFVYTANNQPDTVDGVLYPGYYYPKARAKRIKELLSADKKWTLADVKKVNLDVVSAMHPEIAQEIVLVLKEINKPEYKSLVAILDGWNGDHQLDDLAPSIYYNLLSQIMHGAMVDEIGEEAYRAIMSTSVPKNSYHMFIANDSSPWWDDATTSNVIETRAQIIDRAAHKSLQRVQQIAGENSSDWKWRKFHTLTHPHPLAAVKPLDKIFNVGPFEVPGGSEVINNLHFNLDTTGYFPVNGGPALRKITDFGDVDHGESVSPTGQSGVWFSAHYADQAVLFVNGQFRKMRMNKNEIESRSRKLELLPVY